MFSLAFKAFVVFVTFLLFQSKLYVVLAYGKGPKNSVQRDLFKTKNPKQKNPDTQLHFTQCVESNFTTIKISFLKDVDIDNVNI